MTPDDAASAVVGTGVGTTTFTARALQQLAIGIALDTARVRARDVEVLLSDRRGALRIAVTVPAPETRDQGTSLIDAGEQLRCALIDGMRELAGRDIGSVDVRYSGIRRSAERRVR
jgi:hypothetical protein